ncbi:hypothetical protein BC628DRAFT_1414487 [Trametes gibbosa]|nr:hypothetical protein BC628DRAFT_1414487 [Trametes gibbosa]
MLACREHEEREHHEQEEYECQERQEHKHLKQRAHQEHEEHERKACNEEACSKTGSGDNHQTILGLYELKWAELKTSDTLQGIVRFHKIPFPMFAHHFSCPAEIMYEALMLERPFATSTYPAASFNFGPDAFCVEHTDQQNDPINWIHVAALGEFNPATGGHLILYNLHLAICFPPGSSILFPSAILRHGNVPVAAHEH